MPLARPLSALHAGLLGIIELSAEGLSSHPALDGSGKGRIYTLTTDGSLWRIEPTAGTTRKRLDISGAIVDADVAVGAAISLAKLATDPLARANHTGTQLASTISNLTAAVQAIQWASMAAPTAPINAGGQRITNGADPQGTTDFVTQQFMQNYFTTQMNSGDFKSPAADAVSATNVTIATPGATVGGVTMSAGMSFLAVGQTTGSENGLWTWNGAAVPATRRIDADSSAEVTAGMIVPVETVGLYQLTTPDPIVLGTTALSFAQIGGTSYTQGTGITISGSTISLTIPVVVSSGGTGSTTAAGARTNLGVSRVGGSVAVPALTAGVESSIVIPDMGSNAYTIQLRRVSDRLIINEVELRAIDATHVGVKADTAQSSGLYEVTFNPTAA